MTHDQHIAKIIRQFATDAEQQQLQYCELQGQSTAPLLVDGVLDNPILVLDLVEAYSRAIIALRATAHLVEDQGRENDHNGLGGKLR